MAWQDQIKSDPLPWLLEPESPGVRYLALRDLLDRPAQDTDLLHARKTAHLKGPIAAILDNADLEGWWVRPGPGYNPKYRSGVWSLILLAQLGASPEEDPLVATVRNYCADHALTHDGQFTMTGSAAGTIPCLQGNMCRAMLLRAAPERFTSSSM